MSKASGRKTLHRALKGAVCLVGLPCLAALGFFTWQNFYPVSTASGWTVQVLHRDVPKAASLMPLPDGALMVSQELDDAKGSIVRILTDGTREVVVSNLSKPDGMFATRGGWVFARNQRTCP